MNSNATTETKIKTNPSDHLANERTFLAWIRTSIAVMGFGFVVVKFSLFLKQLSLALGENIAISTRGYSPVIGIVLICTGAAMALLAFVRYRNIEKHLQSGSYFPSFLLSLVVTVAILVVSLLLIVYLLPNV